MATHEFGADQRHDREAAEEGDEGDADDGLAMRERGEFTVGPVATSLEDVFVNLMQGAGNGRQ